MVLVGIGVVVILAVLYGGLRALHGPSSPTALQNKVQAALAQKDMNGLAKLMLPGELTNTTAMETFKASLTDDVMKKYNDALQDEVRYANNSGDALKVLDHSWIKMVRKNTWLGPVWKIAIPVGNIQAGEVPGDKVTMKLGALSAEPSSMDRLFPSKYTVDVTISNDFASTNASQTVNLLEQVSSSRFVDSYSYKFDSGALLKNDFRIDLSQKYDDIKVSLNGKPIALKDNQFRLSPAPDTAEIEVSATVLGVPISEKLSEKTSEKNEIDLSQTIQRGVAKHALDIIYGGALAWTEAWNSGDASKLTNADTSGAYYTNSASAIKEPAKNKVTLQKVAVSPRSVQIRNNNEIQVNEDEYYWYDQAINTLFSSSNNQTLHGTYILKQVPGKAEWWIESGSNSWFSYNSISQDAIEKQNPDAKKG